MPSVPRNKPVGKVWWKVEFGDRALTFKKKKDAEQFRQLLLTSTAKLESAMIRREVTDEGFMLDY